MDAHSVCISGLLTRSAKANAWQPRASMTMGGWRAWLRGGSDDALH
jgi:hypothetical protein